MMGELKTWFQNVRRMMLEEREREVEILRKIQSYRNSFLDWYFFLASNFGEEFFYITFLPFSSWALGNREAGHMVVFMLFVCVGLGNWLKNIFLIPRPPHPRVWTPEGKQKTDHGFPSTHTISFVAAPIYFLLYQYVDKFYRVPVYPFSFTTAAILTGVVSGSVIFSRLYNGYHSPLDVAGGAVFGISFLTMWYFSIRHWLDSLMMFTAFYAPLITLAIGIMMVVFHPRPPEPTAALPESGMLFGTSVGTVIACQLATMYDFHSLLPSEPVYDLSYIKGEEWIHQLVRFLVGMVVVVLIRDVNKRTFTKLVKGLYPDKDLNWVTTVVKFLNYMLISFAILGPIQIIFHLLGIQTDYDLRPMTAFPTGFPN